MTLVEAQGLAVLVSGPRGLFQTLTLSACAPMAAATLPRGRDEVLGVACSPLLPNLVAVESVVCQSGFADLSAAVEIPALVMGGAGSGQVAVWPISRWAAKLRCRRTRPLPRLIGPDQTPPHRGALAGGTPRGGSGLRRARIAGRRMTWIAAFAGAAPGRHGSSARCPTADTARAI